MKTIFKYPLKIEDVQSIEISSEFKFLHLGYDPQGNICIWMEVDSEALKTSIKIYIFGTGKPLLDDMENINFLGTIKQDPFMWHVYASED